MIAQVCQEHRNGVVVIYQGGYPITMCPLCLVEDNLNDAHSQIDSLEKDVQRLKSDIADLKNQIADTLAGENL